MASLPMVASGGGGANVTYLDAKWLGTGTSGSYTIPVASASGVIIFQTERTAGSGAAALSVTLPDNNRFNVVYSGKPNTSYGVTAIEYENATTSDTIGWSGGSSGQFVEVVMIGESA